MVDFQILVASLEQHGHTVEQVIEVPKDAGDAELVVDGKLITSEEARQLLADAESR